MKLEPALRRDIRGGALLSGEYQVNPMLLAEAFKSAAICRRHPSGRCRVTGLRRHGDRIVGVETESEFLPCETRRPNAAGSWAGGLAATAGLDLPVFPGVAIVLTETLPPTSNACLSTSACATGSRNRTAKC